MGLDERVTPIRQHPKSDEATSKAHLKPGWMGILPAVTMSADKSTRKNPAAGGRTGVETTHGGGIQPRRVANQDNANSHTTVTSRAACPIKMLQPATAPAPGQPIGERSCSSRL